MKKTKREPWKIGGVIIGSLLLLVLAVYAVTMHPKIQAKAKQEQKEKAEAKETEEYVMYMTESRAKVLSEPVYLVVGYQELSNTFQLDVSKELNCESEEVTEGFSLYPELTMDFQFESLLVFILDGGPYFQDCNIVIVLQDGTTITQNSTTKKNIEGFAWFDFEDQDLIDLSTTAIESITVTNGYNGYSQTVEVSEINSTYFIELFEALKTTEAVEDWN